ERNRRPRVDVLRHERVRSWNDVGELKGWTHIVSRDGDGFFRGPVHRREDYSDAVAAVALHSARDTTVLCGNRREVQPLTRLSEMKVERRCRLRINRSRIKQRNGKSQDGGRWRYCNVVLPRLQHEESILTEIVGDDGVNQRALAESVPVGRLESLDNRADHRLTLFIRQSAADHAARRQHKANFGKHLSGA